MMSMGDQWQREAERDNDEAADFRRRCDIAVEHVQSMRESVIREQLVKPGSDTYEVLEEATISEQWLNGIDALIRRAANPLPLLPEQRQAIGDELVRMVNAMIGNVAEYDLDRVVEEYVRSGTIDGRQA